MYSNKLLYGKNNLERIVSIEPKDSIVNIYTQDAKGFATKQTLENRYWALSPKNLGQGWVRLEGSLYYQYGRQWTDETEFNKVKYMLKKHDVFFISNPAEACMVKDGYTMFKGMNPSDPTILCFDIETTGIAHDDKSKVILISNTLRRNGNIIKKLFCITDYDNNDVEMIMDWYAWVRQEDPSIVCGHNIIMYDLPYLSYVVGKYDMKLDLGRDNSPIEYNKYESKFRVDGTRDLHYKKCKIYGREIIDTLFLSYKYDMGRKYESYGLKYIIKKEGLEKKDRVFYDASKIKTNWTDKNEIETIKRYCVDDGDDALALYDLMVPALFYTTQLIPKPYQVMCQSASGSQINSLLCRAYLQDGHSLPKADDAVDYEGAISFGVPGIYKNCLSIDVASLYPSIQLTYGIYPKHKDPQAYLLAFLKELREKRLYHKKMAKETGLDYHKNLDTSYKILINSMYGFCGASGLNFNYPAGAAEITRYGREIISKSILWASGKEYTPEVQVA